MMGPTLFHSSTEEYQKILRRMELETYGAVVSTLRAQGELNKDRRKLLEDLSLLMKISPERHKAEVRRAVNDEKLSEIADRTSGAEDTEWAWALEGRRVVPLMPRLVHPTPFTTLATTVSRAVAQNPKICLNQTPVCDDSTSKYVRDPDDEDTLSPVMVPIASPDSSCHSNNNFDSDLNETPTERILTFNLSNEIEKKNEGGLLRTAVPIAPPPVKRPRSPTSNQVVSVAAPLPKIRAVSPSCVRPQHRITAPSQPIFSQGPRGSAVPIIRPPAPIHLTNHSPAPFGKVRIRPPVVSANIQRATVRPAAPQNTLTGINAPRFTNNVKQIVQVRAPQPSKETNKTPAAVVTANSVAPSLAKTLPAKANVIVLHKNSPLVKNMQQQQQQQQQQTLATKDGNFLAKSVSTPTGTKMTFPSNVRIISVPTGSNIGVASGGNAGASGQKVIASTGSAPTSQKNVYVLELSNDNMGKSILLGDIIPAGLVPEVNGVKAKLPAQNVHVKAAVKEEPESRSQTLSFAEESAGNNGQEASSTTGESEEFLRKCGFEFPTKESCAEANNVGNHVLVQSVNETVNQSSELFDQPSEIVCDSSKEDVSTIQVMEQSSMDIFSTAIASADINLDTNTFHEDNGGSRLVLKDVYDSPSAKL